MPKVTVIIPNYNHSPFLVKRIESVLAQTYQDFDLIIMDDCSTDNSREIIDNYALQDKRISILYNKENSGSTFKQWNKGISQAKGEYIWIAESDDYADERFLEHLVNQLDHFSTAGIAYCQSWMVNEKNEIIDSADKMYTYISKDHWQQDYFNTGVEECKNFLVIQNTIPNTSAIVFRKKTYLQAGLANESMKFLGDWLQWIKMLLISDIVFIARHLNYFRQHTSTTRTSASSDHRALKEYYLVLGFVSKQSCIYSEEAKKKSLEKRWRSVWNKPYKFRGLINLFKAYSTARQVDSWYLIRILYYLTIRLTYKPKSVMKTYLTNKK